MSEAPLLPKNSSAVSCTRVLASASKQSALKSSKLSLSTNGRSCILVPDFAGTYRHPRQTQASSMIRTFYLAYLTAIVVAWPGRRSGPQGRLQSAGAQAVVVDGDTDRYSDSTSPISAQFGRRLKRIQVLTFPYQADVRLNALRAYDRAAAQDATYMKLDNLAAAGG